MNSLLDRIRVERQLLQGSADVAGHYSLDVKGLRGIKEAAFVRIAAKVQRYIDISLCLRREYAGFDGLPLTELATNADGTLVPVGIPPSSGDDAWACRTAAIDQQRQLYAAATAVLIDPGYGATILSQLVDWHDAFVRNFVIDGHTVRATVVFRPNRVDREDPGQQAQLRFTYALQGTATLARATRAVADHLPDLPGSHDYTAKADEMERLAFAIAEQFHSEYADPTEAGRYFVYPNGHSPQPALHGLSHNNSQSYLIEGMLALIALNAATWQPRLDDLLSFIHAQRDEQTDLLHEFNFASGSFLAEAASVPDLKWQVVDQREIVILGHTIAGLYAAPARMIADSSGPERKERMTKLVEQFIESMTKIGGIHENALPANAFLLLPGGDPSFIEMGWPEGAWQVELLWQFLLHADRAGVDLGAFVVAAGRRSVTLDRLLADSLRVHDRELFDGPTYVAEKGKPLTGRAPGAPINHAADTLRDLSRNLAEDPGR